MVKEKVKVNGFDHGREAPLDEHISSTDLEFCLATV
jgi:hypothetical protein